MLILIKLVEKVMRCVRHGAYLNCRAGGALGDKRDLYNSDTEDFRPTGNIVGSVSGAGVRWIIGGRKDRRGDTAASP